LFSDPVFLRVWLHRLSVRNHPVSALRFRLIESRISFFQSCFHTILCRIDLYQTDTDTRVDLPEKKGTLLFFFTVFG
jgi:hypothetical protein